MDTMMTAHNFTLCYLLDTAPLPGSPPSRKALWGGFEGAFGVNKFFQRGFAAASLFLNTTIYREPHVDRAWRDGCTAEGFCVRPKT